MTDKIIDAFVIIIGASFGAFFAYSITSIFCESTHPALIAVVAFYFAAKTAHNLDKQKKAKEEVARSIEKMEKEDERKNMFN